MMVTVDVSKYKDFDKALCVFRTKVRQAQVMELANRKAHYISPSEKTHRSRVKKHRK